MLLTRQVQLLCSVLFISSTASASIAHYDYVTSVNVNGINVLQAVTATQASQLLSQSPSKLTKQYSECTGNYEFSAKSGAKSLTFEIYADENPHIKNDQYYKNKANFAALAPSKGHVWLDWKPAQTISDQITIGSKKVSPGYTLQQFKTDFPKSAQSASTNGIGYVLMLQAKDVKAALKDPENYDVPYTANTAFTFKNGKLVQLSIQQDIAC